MKITQPIKNFWRKNSPIFLWQISGNAPPEPYGRPIDPWKGNESNGEIVFDKSPLTISDYYWHSFDWLRDLRELGHEKAIVPKFYHGII